MPAALIKADKSRSDYKSECCNNSVSIRISDCFNSQWQGKPGQRLLSSQWGIFSLTAYQRSKLTALSNQRKRARPFGKRATGAGGTLFHIHTINFGRPRFGCLERKRGGWRILRFGKPGNRIYRSDNLDWKMRICTPYVVFSICFLTNINVGSRKTSQKQLENIPVS